MSLALHSSTEYLGGGRRSMSSGSNSRSSRSSPVKSSIGLMSRKVSARPRSRNHWNESRWMAIRSGRGRTSSRFANEKRSRVAERDGKSLTPQKGEKGGHGSGVGARANSLTEMQEEARGSARQPESLPGVAGLSKPRPKAAAG